MVPGTQQAFSNNHRLPVQGPERFLITSRSRLITWQHLGYLWPTHECIVFAGLWSIEVAMEVLQRAGNVGDCFYYFSGKH